MPVRYGGDEFVVLLPETDQGVARAAAERIRARLAETRFLASSPPGLGVTASSGVATCPDAGDSAGEVVQAADAAMYRVKATTRNAVAQAGDDGRSPPVPA